MLDKMKIKLTDYEIRMVVNVGIERRIQSIDMGLKHKYGYDGDSSWDINIEGAAAEQALAKALDCYWDGSVGTFKKPDIGTNIQVRMTKLSNGSLIVRESDCIDDYYFLVIGKIPNYEIVGYILGQDARQDEFWQTPNGRSGAWFVPQSKLIKLKVDRC